jgi:hypothetical protein
MKRRHFFLYISIVISKANFGQPDNDEKSLNNNKVVSVTSYYARTSESQLEEFLNTPSWYQKNISDSNVYNNKGKLVLHRLIIGNNRNNYYDTKYEYNNAGLLTKMVEFNGATIKKTDSLAYNIGNLLSYHKIYYNSNNYLLFENKVDYTYKKRNLPVEIRTFSPDGKLNTITVKLYDAKDRLIEEILYWGSTEAKDMNEKKKYIYHSEKSKVIKEIQTYKNENADLYFIKKFDESGFMIENISYDPKKKEIRDKTTITKANNQIVETYFDYVQTESLPTTSGNTDETAPMIRGEKELKPVRKNVTILSKNGLIEITKQYSIDPSGKENFGGATKYEYRFVK